MASGEAVGIVGMNGAGKSTLLQIIVGTLSADSGSATVAGKVSAILELGAGFHPEFSGVDNVRINGALLGLDAGTIEERLPSIVEFSEIGEYAFLPVKTYSTGMYVRLAFSVMIHTSPDLLVIDEALSVGDAGFQAKCKMWMHDFKASGGSLLFVSHDIVAVQSLCDRAIYLEEGRLKDIGEAGPVCDHFLRDVHEKNNAVVGKATVSTFAKKATIPPVRANFDTEFRQFCSRFEQQWAGMRQGTGEARIRLVTLCREDGEPIEVAKFGEEAWVRLWVECFSDCQVSVNYKIRDKNLISVVGADFLIAGQELLSMKAGQMYCVEYRSQLWLGPGDYSLRLSVTRPIDRHAQAAFLDIIEVALPFQVLPSKRGWIYTKAYLPNTVQVQLKQPQE